MPAEAPSGGGGGGVTSWSDPESVEEVRQNTLDDDLNLVWHPHTVSLKSLFVVLFTLCKQILDSYFRFFCLNAQWSQSLFQSYCSVFCCYRNYDFAYGEVNSSNSDKRVIISRLINYKTKLILISKL